MSDSSPRVQPTRTERQAYKWVMKMLDDPGRHAVALERWLNKDPEHRAIYKRVAIEIGYASDAAVELPSLRVAAAHQPARSWFARPRYLILSAGLAAAAAVLALLGWQTIAPQWLSTKEGRELAQSFEIHEGSKKLTLADRSRVTLTGASSLKIRFGVKERAVDLLKGRARFDVEHDSSRPFVVYVRGGSITAVGTVFEVDADSGLVRLVEGRVTVALPQPAGSSAKPKFILTPGEQITFAGSDQPEETGQQAARQDPPTRRMQSFDDVPASTIIAAVNQHSQVKIVLADPKIGEEKIFADLDIRDADAVARKLASALGLGIDRSAPGQLRLYRSN